MHISTVSLTDVPVQRTVPSVFCGKFQNSLSPVVREYGNPKVTVLATLIHTAMSFGFKVRDILAVGTLVRNVYTAYAGAPEQFQNLSQEVLSLHVAARKVEDQLGISGYAETGVGSATVTRQPDSGGIGNLSRKDKDDLRMLYDGLQTLMKEMDDLLKKSQNSALHGNPIDRLRCGQEDLAELRDKVRSNITLLTAFNMRLAECVLSLFTCAGFKPAKIIFDLLSSN